MRALVVLVYAIAVVTIAVLGLGYRLTRSAPTSVEPLPKSLSAGLALQLPRSARDVARVLGDKPEQRELVRRNLALDGWFIVLYTGQFVLLGVLLTQRGEVWALPLGVVAVLGALAAASCDVLENSRTAAILDAPLDASADPLAARIHYAARTKWALVFAVTALLTPVFYWTGPLSWIGWICLSCYLVAAVLGLIGVLRADRTIEVAVLLASLGSVLMAGLFLCKASQVVQAITGR